ncbi:amidohydrolase family protein [Lachnospiraceae bacterium 62-35]
MKLLLTNVNLVDVMEGKIKENVDIRIDGNRIVEIGKNLPQKEEEQMDASGKWAMPGLINMHEHQSYKRLIGPLFGENGACAGMNGAALGIRAVRDSIFSLKSGITTLFEAGAIRDLSFSMRKAIETGVIPGPRMVVSGRFLTSVDGHCNELAKEVADWEQMKREIDENIEKGAEWIKLMCSDEPVEPDSCGEPVKAGFSQDMIAQVVKRAHGRGRKVAVHAMGTEALDRVIGAGVDAVHHGAYLSQSQARRMHEKNIAFVSTISAYRNTSNPVFDRGEDWIAENLQLRPPFETATKNALNEGVLIACGTDSMGDLFHEMAFLKQYGMDTPECLRTVTINGAKILGLEQQLGSIEAGKLADIVLYEKNPMEDFENMRKPALVIKDGDVYDMPNLTLQNMADKWLVEYTPMV